VSRYTIFSVWITRAGGGEPELDRYERLKGAADARVRALGIEYTHEAWFQIREHEIETPAGGARALIVAALNGELPLRVTPGRIIYATAGRRPGRLPMAVES